MRLLAPTVQASRLNRRAGQRAGFWPNGAFGGDESASIIGQITVDNDTPTVGDTITLTWIDWGVYGSITATPDELTVGDSTLLEFVPMTLNYQWISGVDGSDLSGETTESTEVEITALDQALPKLRVTNPVSGQSVVFNPPAVTINPVPPNSVDVDLTTGLVAYWPLSDKNASIGGFNLSTVNAFGPGSGITFTAGKNGSAATWANDITQHLFASDNATLKFGDRDWTVVMWVNFTRVGSTNSETLLAKGNAEAAREVLISRFQNRLDLTISDGGTTAIIELQFPNAIPSNGWYRIAARNVASTKVATLVVNDTAVQGLYTGTPGTGNGVFALGSHTIGYEGTGLYPTNSLTGGQIDEVGLYNVALTDEALLAHYNAGTGLFAPFSGTETLEFSQPRIVGAATYGIGAGVDVTKGSATKTTAQVGYTLATPARNMKFYWANSFANWNGSADGEGLITTPTTIRAAAYVSGRNAAEQLTFSAANSKEIAALGLEASDTWARSALRNQVVKVRTEASAASGATWPGTSQGDWQNISASDVLLNAVSYNPGTDGEYHFAACLIIGEVPTGLLTGRKRNTCAIRGDSISPYIQEICQAEGIPHIYFGRAGEAIEDTIGTKDSARKLLTRLADVVVDQYGVNDIRSGRTAAQLQADKVTKWTEWVSSGCNRIVTVTITPTIGHSTTDRNNYNTWLKGLNSASVSALVGKTVSYTCIDICPAVEVSNGSNTWLAGMTDDDVHPNTTGKTAIKTAYGTPIADAISAELL